MTLQTTDRTGARTGRRFWFGVDAAVTGVNAVAYLAAAGPLADLFGGEAATYRWLGAFLALYAAAVAAYTWTAVPARAGWAVVAANELWVVGSLGVALVGAFGLDAVGRVWVVMQAVVVGALALLQARALRRG